MSRTSYYERPWGFCLPSEQRAAPRQGAYEVEIAASLEAGALVYGELIVSGRSDREFLVCTHICHPSLANDKLTGIAAAVAVADYLSPGHVSPILHGCNVNAVTIAVGQTVTFILCGDFANGAAVNITVNGVTVPTKPPSTVP